jgi:DNA (cytosine-5)-methyltransferase 1
MRIGSLFSGVGGLELGLEWAGLGPVLWQVEKDELCRSVLARRWPAAERFEDVCKVGAAQLVPVDLICGGFPCQNNSSANSTGARTGLAGSSSGLWSEFARVLGILAPPWAVVENVTSGAELWLDEVVGALGELGYETLCVPLSAADVGAPHGRARLFVVARHAHAHREPVVAEHAEVADVQSPAGRFPGWSSRPDLRVVDGVPGGLARFGNAVVPQCAEVVGHIIQELRG